MVSGSPTRKRDMPVSIDRTAFVVRAGVAVPSVGAPDTLGNTRSWGFGSELQPARSAAQSSTLNSTPCFSPINLIGIMLARKNSIANQYLDLISAPPLSPSASLAVTALSASDSSFLE